MSQKTSIIFGGTGFIGSALARELVFRGEKVLSISRHIPEIQETGVEYFAVDIESDVTGLRGILARESSIFLLTGQTYPGFDAGKEKEIFGKILNGIELASPEKIIFASSALIYGDCGEPANEEIIPNPKDAYSAFKLECERMLLEKFPQIPVGILRLANVYGSEKNKGFIGLVFKKILDGSEMKVNGDGLQERDYIFLDDVVSATVAIRNGLDGSDTVNVATGTSPTLLDVIHLAEKVSGRKISYEVTGVPIDEVGVSRIDATKLKEKYGFEAQVSLAEGLKKTWERYQEVA